MFEFLTESDENAFSVLKSDHDKAKELFERFEKAESLREKKAIAAEAIMELKIHTLIEEEIFYPAVRTHVEKKLMNEADEEHHVAKFLIAELEHMDGTEDHYDAKFKVLSENVRHHVKEEEGDMFPKARGAKVDFEKLGLTLLARKEYLKTNGIPEMEEDEMIARAGINNDSPARLSRNPASRKQAQSLKTQKKAKLAAKVKSSPQEKVIKLKPKRAVRKPSKPAKSAKLAKTIAKTARKPAVSVKKSVSRSAVRRVSRK